MKYYFFVNPAAGQGKNIDKLISDIEAALLEEGVAPFDYSISMTTASGDGEKRARELAEQLHGEEGRFYACGGDGTANEIINGICGVPEASIGILPIGTGNDTVRNFPEGDFLDLKRQIKAEPEPIDLMKYSGKIDGREQERYCVNMFNIGFDCNVVELAGRLKQKPLIAGSFAYLMAIFGMFVKKKGISLTIEEEGKVIREGEMLLCAVSNGSYCGGGVKSAPQAVMNDGWFDVNIINDVSRATFAKMLPSYQKGTHLEVPGAEEIIQVRKSKAVTLKPYGSRDFFICADGEISLTEGIKIEICESAIRFLVPKEI